MISDSDSGNDLRLDVQHFLGRIGAVSNRIH